MSLRIDFPVLLGIVAVGQSILLFVYFLLRRPKNSSVYLLLPLLLIFAFDVTHRLLIDTRYIVELPILIGTATLFKFAFGPLIFLLALSLLKTDFRFKKIQFLHFLPFLLHTSGRIPWFWTDASTKIKAVNHFFAIEDGGGSPGTVSSLNAYLENFLSGEMHTMIYLLATVLLLWKGKSISGKTSIRRRNWACFVVVGFFAIWLIHEVSTIYALTLDSRPLLLDSYRIWRPAYLCGFTYAALFMPLEFVKKKKPKLSESQSQRYLRQIQTLFLQEKPYLNAGFGSNELCQKLDISPTYLSEIVNKSLGKRIDDFINEYRIAAAKEELQSDFLETHTVEALAEKTGFASKSTFFRHFKKHTGTTPMAYRKQMK